jgi:hypothetical protein
MNGLVNAGCPGGCWWSLESAHRRPLGPARGRPAQSRNVTNRGVTVALDPPLWTGHTSPRLSAIATPNRALCTFWAGGDPDAIAVLIRRQLRGGRSGVEWSGVGISGIPSLARRDVQHIDDPAPVSVRGTHPAAHRFPFRVSTRPASQRSIACCPGQAHPSVQRPGYHPTRRVTSALRSWGDNDETHLSSAAGRARPGRGPVAQQPHRLADHRAPGRAARHRPRLVPAARRRDDPALQQAGERQAAQRRGQPEGELRARRHRHRAQHRAPGGHRQAGPRPAARERAPSSTPSAWGQCSAPPNSSPRSSRPRSSSRRPNCIPESPRRGPAEQDGQPMSRWWRSQVAIAAPTSAIRPGGRRSR